MAPTTPQEVHKITSSLKAKKSCGHDDISTSFLKNINGEVATPISILINNSFAECIVPDILKIAKVIPIYKSKDKDEFINYRPIFLLPALSKVLEKAMHIRLFSFLKTNNILYQSQYGFR